MKSISILAAALLAGAVSAPTLAAPPASLAVDSQVRGEITTADAVNYSDGSRSKLYRLDLRNGQVVSFDVSGSLRARLSLFDADRLVSNSREGSDNGASLVVRASGNGPYLLAVSGADADAFGPYTLKSTTVEPYDGSVLRKGASISDWTDRPRQLPLQVDSEALYTIDMQSDDFDAVLRIEGNGVSTSNDDGGEGSNARLNVVLKPGRYTLTADGYSDRINGLYRLSVVERDIPAGALAGGGTIALDSESTGFLQGTPAVYRFTLPQRRLVTIDMRSSEFDSVLKLTGNGVERSDDDGGEGLDARIVAPLDAGEYSIEANALSDAAGMFTLSLATSGIPEGTGGGALTVDRAPTSATLLPGASDRYTVSIRRAGDYVIDMTSDDFDSHLRLSRDGREVASDDDGGGGLNARIAQHLEAGDYVIEAGALGGDGDGGYRIGIARR
ncbi:hypothetical protein LDO26_01515 [Luteimonas sp. BDR2-5]|uniref:hypothetical protein n=1 Tax=Proluteimonas luteida TaxID=2878685 RepID=UPI001E65CA92|nr:hypothetical protein [Luteimonas sp. BDR2-5]MCD9026893.1 hypothetical protein [Luteimonas sp. BDR2-5]